MAATNLLRPTSPGRGGKTLQLQGELREAGDPRPRIEGVVPLLSVGKDW